MTDLYPHLTNELVPQPVTQNGVAVTAGIAYSIVPNGQDAGTWTPAVVRDSATFFRVQDMAPGVYRKWAQATVGDEVAVIDCGTITIV